MTELFQIMNFQHQQVKMCKTQDEAERYIESLLEVYNEGFYIVVLKVVYSVGVIN